MQRKQNGIAEKSYSNRSGKMTFRYNAIALDKRPLKGKFVPSGKENVLIRCSRCRSPERRENISKNIQEYENIIFEVPLNDLMQQENEEIQNVEEML
ncbi:hypothetical protein V1477_003401 [Vespula maculifrons]|uniref:Uncharacterized protein n=1 Tax=Vespula maculifrons TaxID=7453 RepID=A0ABD2CX68_VESMC